MSDETSNSEQDPVEETPSTAGSTPPPQTSTPRLLRRDEGSVIAGVCSGLGAYTGIDPVIWRVGFVIFGLTSIGVLAYIVLWLVMPKARPGEPVPTVQHNMDVGRWIGIGAILLGALVAFRGLFGFFDFFHGGIFWGLVLIAIGVAIWGRDWSGGPGKRTPPAQPPPTQTPWWPAPSETAASPAAATTEPTPESPASAAVTTPMATTPMATPMSTTPMASRPVAPRPSPAPKKPRREPSILGRLVVGAAALAIGAALLLENLGAYRATPRGILGVLLGLVGVGLLVGSWAGRARWLIIPGSLLALALIVVSIIPFNVRGGWGEIAWSPQSEDEIQARYEHSAGQAALDLSEINFGQTDQTIDVRLGFGELYIVIPDEPNVVVDAHVQGGEISLFGRTTEGWDVSQHVSDDGEKERAAVLTIDTEVTFGEVHVLRGTSSDVPGLMNNRFGPGRFGFENRFDNQGG